MKRLIASRKLQRPCIHCNCGIHKGNVYYQIRTVTYDEDEVFAQEYIECARCKYKMAESKRRFELFVEKCPHPDGFVELVWSYIPGEAVMQPDHDVCRLCKKWF